MNVRFCAGIGVPGCGGAARLAAEVPAALTSAASAAVRLHLHTWFNELKESIMTRGGQTEARGTHVAR